MLLETIKIVNGIAQFLEFHNQRLNHARRILFQAQDDIDLKNVITAPSKNQTYKCRVIYSKTIEAIEYSLYQERQFKTLKVIKSDNLVYDFKYANRADLNHLMDLKGQADDVLIIKNGFVTDTTIANVAFFYRNQWFTPATPLLKGTTRARLLKENKIIEASISLDNLNKFSKMALMNALLGFYII